MTQCCPVCFEEVSIIQGGENYWRLANHSSVEKHFLECAGSGRQVILTYGSKTCSESNQQKENDAFETSGFRQNTLRN